MLAFPPGFLSLYLRVKTSERQIWSEREAVSKERGKRKRELKSLVTWHVDSNVSCPSTNAVYHSICRQFVPLKLVVFVHWFTCCENNCFDFEVALHMPSFGVRRPRETSLPPVIVRYSYTKPRVWQFHPSFAFLVWSFPRHRIPVCVHSDISSWFWWCLNSKMHAMQIWHKESDEVLMWSEVWQDICQEK